MILALDSSLYISYDAEVRRGLVAPPPPLQTQTQHANTPARTGRRTLQLDQARRLPGLHRPGQATFDERAPDQYNEWTLALPSWLPGSEHAVLRWEWTSVQQVSNIEFYVGCADVKIVGTAETPDSSFLAKVTPVSAFTGT